MPQSIGPLLVDADACLRRLPVGVARSDCTRCLQRCPTEAIDLDPVRVDPGRCDGCRLCVPACDSGALAVGDRGRRAEAAACQRVEPGATFTIACGRASSGLDQRAARLPCLASIDSALSVAVFAGGAASLELHDGGCQACRLGAIAAEVLPDLQADLAAVADAFCRTVRRVSHPGGTSDRPADPVKDPTLSRREAFGGLFGRGRDLLHAAAVSVERQAAAATGSEPQDTEIAPDLRAFAAARINSGRAPATTGSAPVGGTPTVAGGVCGFCGLCAVACAPKALTIDHDAAALMLAPQRCTDCGACAPACDERVLEVRRGTELSAWGRSIPIAAARKVTCKVCGEPALSTAVAYCAGCYRSHRWAQVGPLSAAG